MKNKQPEIYIDRNLVYHSHHIGLCSTREIFAAECKRLECDEVYPFVNSGANATCHFLVKDDGKKIILCCIKAGKEHTNIQIAALLVHEAVHIFQTHCDDIGERHPSSEFEAYSIQNIATCLWEEYIRQTT